MKDRYFSLEKWRPGDKYSKALKGKKEKNPTPSIQNSISSRNLSKYRGNKQSLR